MAYVPGFRYDLFISYASADNHDGWVERLERQLSGELSRLLGRGFSDKGIFLDRRRLQVGQAYPEELDEAARESALLIACLSPSYLTSDWCSREREKFQDHLAPGANFPQCLAALRLRECQSLPDALKTAQRCDFLLEGFQEPWPAGSPKWIEIANRLAAEIRDALQNLRSRSGAVFLGPTLPKDPDLRDRIADYLSQQHFRATPDDALLDDQAASGKELLAAKCAVHFLGGATPRALARLEDSVQHCAGPTILFQPFGAQLSQDEEYVLGEIDASKYQLIRNDETDLKKYLEDLLTQVRLRDQPQPSDLGVVCDQPDLNWAAAFQAPGRDVTYPRFLEEKLTATERLRRWESFLRGSRALMFYHGQSSEERLQRLWAMAQDKNNDALREWFLAQPDLDSKKTKRPSAKIYPDHLDDFLKRLER